MPTTDLLTGMNDGLKHLVIRYAYQRTITEACALGMRSKFQLNPAMGRHSGRWYEQCRSDAAAMLDRQITDLALDDPAISAASQLIGRLPGNRHRVSQAVSEIVVEAAALQAASQPDRWDSGAELPLHHGLNAWSEELDLTSGFLLTTRRNLDTELPWLHSQLFDYGLQRVTTLALTQQTQSRRRHDHRTWYEHPHNNVAFRIEELAQRTPLLADPLIVATRDLARELGQVEDRWELASKFIAEKAAFQLVSKCDKLPDFIGRRDIGQVTKVWINELLGDQPGHYGKIEASFVSISGDPGVDPDLLPVMTNWVALATGLLPLTSAIDHSLEL